MTYSIEVASFLSGASINQLQRWAHDGILIPEIHQERPKIYSFRDIVALRSITKLRATNSLQRIREALNHLDEFDFNEHLSEYRFATDGKSIKIWDDEKDHFLDVVKNPGQWEVINLEDVYAPFMNLQGRRVPDLRTPAKGIRIDPQRLGGVHTLDGTRIPFDLMVDLSNGDMSAEEIADFYPDIEIESIQHAIDFDASVRKLVA